jgi:hypothetical protein
MRLGVGAWNPQDGMIARASAMQHSPKCWFYLYVAALVIATMAFSVAWVVPGLLQPLLAVATLKWAFYYMLVYGTFVWPRAPRSYFFIALVAEFLMGIGAFFSDFKSVLFFTAFGLLAAGIKLKPKQVLSLGILVVVTIMLGIVWTAVKREYRDFVAGGKESQAVVVPYEARVEELVTLVSAIDGEKFGDATSALLDRLAYVDFFAAVLEMVPKQLPHENGALWWDAVTRPFMPRLLFPNKPIIDDSERTRQYTGLAIYGTESGASISIGYMGESYIDFGAIGMMGPLLAFGFFLGRLYRWMLNRDPTRLLGMSLATAIIFGASFLESSITKVFGGLIVATLVSLLVLRYGPRFYPLVQRWSGR